VNVNRARMVVTGIVIGTAAEGAAGADAIAKVTARGGATTATGASDAHAHRSNRHGAKRARKPKTTGVIAHRNHHHRAGTSSLSRSSSNRVVAAARVDPGPGGDAAAAARVVIDAAGISPRATAVAAVSNRSKVRVTSRPPAPSLPGQLMHRLRLSTRNPQGECSSPSINRHRRNSATHWIP
jgi:hypothetical protein